MILLTIYFNTCLVSFKKMYLNIKLIPLLRLQNLGHFDLVKIIFTRNNEYLLVIINKT